MNQLIPIHKLSAQTGLTSRTLRHWESEGLFSSLRDSESGWRVYDHHAVLCIEITAMLRKLNVPICEIKTITDHKTYEKLKSVINNQLSTLRVQTTENSKKEELLLQFLSFVDKQSDPLITDTNLPQFLSEIQETMNIQNERKQSMMTNQLIDSKGLKFITLPSMRAAYHIAVSSSPENEAMAPVLKWLKSENLTGTARLFGGNMKPVPSGNGKAYGYGMCASIPENIIVPKNLKEMHLPGGLYALFESSDDIGGSWKTLLNLLSQNSNYQSDRSRLCLEEHIRNDSPDNSGNEYYISLLEPVKIKKNL